MPTRQDNNLLQDFTVAINKIPRAWNLLDSMNIAETVGVTSETVNVDVVTEKTNTFGDARRGGQRNFVEAESVITKPLSIPFFPLDGVVRPTDLQNLRMWGTEDQPQTVNDAVERVMMRLRRYQGAIREKALVEAVKGSAYAPNGTVAAQDYYTIFGETKTQVAFDLTNAAVDVKAKIEEAWGTVIDNADDGASSYEVVALCGTGFFNKLIDNAGAKDAYTYYSSTQEPLRNRQGGGSIYREFVFMNVKFIEYRGAFNGSALLPTEEAFFFPTGIEDMFKVYHAPADHLDFVNQEGEELYMFLNRASNGRKIDVESETALLAVNHRPNLVIQATSAASF